MCGLLKAATAKKGGAIKPRAINTSYDAIINILAAFPTATVPSGVDGTTPADSVPDGISAGNRVDINNDGHVGVGDIMAIINIMANNK